MEELPKHERGLDVCGGVCDTFVLLEQLHYAKHDVDMILALVSRI